MADSLWSNQRVDLIILQEDVSGFSGLFGYSPSIGAGNLIFSLAAVSGTDPYGNVYPAGLNATLAPNVVQAGNVAPGALDNFTFSNVTINGQTVSGANVIVSQSAGGIYVYASGGTIVQTFNSTGTWVAPVGVTTVKAECWGAGGGGAGSRASSSLTGGGGGGGEYAAEPTLVVTPGNTYSFIVGGAGTAGPANTSGGSGGHSSFTGDLVTVNAHGGNGGGVGVSGGKGTGSTNTTHFDGGYGFYTGDVADQGGGGASSGGTSSAGTPTVINKNQTAGASAQTGGGPGGNGGIVSPPESNGTGFSPSVRPGGGGGGGAFAGPTDHPGGAGAPGMVRLTYTGTPNLLLSATGAAGTDPIAGNSVPQGLFIAGGIISFLGTSGENAHAQIFATGRQLWLESPKLLGTDDQGFLEIVSAAAGGNAASTLHGTLTTTQGLTVSAGGAAVTGFSTVTDAVSGVPVLLVQNTTAVPTQTSFRVIAAAAADKALGIAVTGDTNNRLMIDSNGVHNWGPGNVTQDTNLYRATANSLKTDDLFTAALGLVALAGGASVTGGTTTDTLHVTSTSTLNGKETITAGGLAVTGGTATDTLSTTSTSSMGGKVTITAGGLAVTGGTTSDTLSASSGQAAGGVLAVTNTTAAPSAPTAQFIGAAAADRMLGVEVAGDAAFRFRVDTNGRFDWGPGSAGTDTNLYRAAASSLKTDDAFTAALGLTATAGGLTVSAGGASVTGGTTSDTLTVTGKLTATGGTISVPTLVTTDIWNTLGTLAGFTVQVGRYRLTPHNEVLIDIEITAGGANAGSVNFSVTLPAAYRPLVSRHLPMSSTRAVTAADVWPRLFVTTAGVVTVLSQASTTASLGTIVAIPLD